MLTYSNFLLDCLLIFSVIGEPKKMKTRNIIMETPTHVASVTSVYRYLTCMPRASGSRSSRLNLLKRRMEVNKHTFIVFVWFCFYYKCLCLRTNKTNTVDCGSKDCEFNSLCLCWFTEHCTRDALCHKLYFVLF